MSLQDVHDTLQSIPNKVAGSTLIGLGGFGSFIQAITDWANTFAAVGNAVLVAGGLYFMWLRFFDKRRNRRASDREEG